MARDLGIFVDESSDRGGKARYYLLTLVIHDQSEGIADKIARYEQSLLDSDLPNIPFHSEPLLNGHGPHEGISLQAHQRELRTCRKLVQARRIMRVDANPMIISGERFCEGFLLGYLDNGKMLSSMKGLEELDGT